MEHDTQPRSESATHDASVAVVAAGPVLRSFEAHYARAAAFASQRHFDDAIVAYRDALAVRPLDLETHLNLGLVLQARGRFDEAIDAYQAATRIAPGVAETQVRLGQALAQRARPRQRWPHSSGPSRSILSSGVYYVRVPGIVKAGNAGEAGCLKFGRPCAGTAGAAAQAETLTASIRPQEGMIVVFPSYFWHCTVPFESDEERICIAFDVIRPRASGDAGR